MKRPIWFVAGSKGGIGKSTVAELLIDYAKHFRREQVYLVDTDPGNPDVARPYSLQADVDVEFDTIAARDVQGWLDTLEAAEEHPNRLCIINGAAGDIVALTEASHLLKAVADLERELVVWWVVSGEVESVVLLYRYLAIMGTAAAPPHRRLVVTLNPGPANERRFRDYFESQTAQRLESENCPVIRLPYLAEDVAKEVRRRKANLAQARVALSALRRSELNRWVNEAASAFDGVVGDE